MALVRNVSGQSIVISRMGGGAMQLMPQRAAELSEADQVSGQIKSLLQNGLLMLEEPAAHKGAAKKAAKRGAARGKSKKKKK